MDDQLNPLGAIGLGLMSAGGSLSSEVYQQNANMYSQQRAQEQKRKEFLATILTDHYQKGTLSKEGYTTGMRNLGYQIQGLKQKFDVTGLQSKTLEEFDKGLYLDEGNAAQEPTGLGVPGGLRSPPQATQPDIAGLPPPTAGVSQSEPLPIALNQDPGKKLEPVDVVPKTPGFIDNREINRTMAMFVSQLPADMPASDKANAVVQMKKDLRTQQREKLDEATKLMQFQKEKRAAAKPETLSVPVGKENWEVQFDPDEKLKGERLPGNPAFAVIAKGEKGPLVKIYQEPDPTKQLEIANGMNLHLEQSVKPLRDDLYTIRQVRQLLATDTGASNQQVRDLLAGMFATTRQTNMLYSKNTSFGSLANRMTSVLSQFATGKFNEESRRQLREMIDEMENKVIKPEMNAHVNAVKSRAKAGNVNPELISLPEMPAADESSNMPQSAQDAADKYLKKFEKQ